jgi:hypothetical protein
VVATMKAEFEQKFKAVSEEKEAIRKEFEASVNGLKKDVYDFIELFRPILDIPSAEPIETPKNKFAASVDKKAKTLSQFKIS